jgi:hypothetical protein
MMVGRHLLPIGLLAYIGCAEGKDIDVWRLPAGSGGVGGGAPSAGGGTGVGAGGSRTIGADAGGNCGAGVTVANTIALLAPAAPGADTYIDFRFSSSQASIGPGETLDFAFQMQGPNPAVDVFLQNNDYSFDSSKTTPTAWGHVVLLQNGNVLWGSPP